MPATKLSADAIFIEHTPNPATLKFMVGQPIVPAGAADFPRAVKAGRSPLAQRLFALEGVGGVFLGRDFVTITENERTDWTELAPRVKGAIADHLNAGQPVLEGAADSAGEGQGDVERRIIEILDREIRPAVAMDGGDITFGGYEDGVVRLYLKGSCSGCPSSTMTLRMGIENRLREEIPEIVEVVSM